MKIIAILVAICAALVLASAGSTAEREAKPDFAVVRSIATARALVVEGKLVKVLLFPAELGGKDVPENVVYVPPAAAQAKALITGTLIRFLREGLIDHLDVRPEYRGDSVVPTRIAMRATSRKRSGEFSPAIEVW